MTSSYQSKRFLLDSLSESTPMASDQAVKECSLLTTASRRVVAVEQRLLAPSILAQQVKYLV